MSKKLKQRIKALERRVAELEARTPLISYTGKAMDILGSQTPTDPRHIPGNLGRPKTEFERMQRAENA